MRCIWPRARLALPDNQRRPTGISPRGLPADLLPIKNRSMVREILIWPHPVLKQKAKPVKSVDETIRKLVRDMFETMYSADGVGLAAPQVGVLHNVIVLDTTSRQPESKPMAMVNPKIVAHQGMTTYNEGCLSIPGEAEDVERFAQVTVSFLDVEGQPQILEAEGLFSIAIQHEMDHLLGVVFVDHLSSLKRDLIKKRMKRLKIERSSESPASAP